MDSDHLHQKLQGFRLAAQLETQDEYYATPQARLNTLVGEDAGQVFARLQRVRNEYEELCLQQRTASSTLDFALYVEQQYGIKLTMLDGMMQLEYRITDPALHTLFLLKFSP